MRFRRTVPKHVDPDDMATDGNIGLIDAIQKFDPSRKVKFGSYALRRISGAIVDSMRDSSHLSRLSLDRVQKYLKTQSELARELECIPTPEEIQARLGLNDVIFRRTERDVRQNVHQSIDLPISHEGKNTYIRDIVVDQHSRDPIEIATRDDLIEFVLRAIPPSMALMLCDYFLRGVSMKQIAQRIEKSQSAVSIRIRKILAYVRYVVGVELEAA